MAKIKLTDRFIKSRKAAPTGQRADYSDAIVPGMALRVTDSGHKSFVLVARYPTRPANPTRRALGDYGAISLDEARQLARDWLGLIKRGIDPKVEAERQRAAEQRRQFNSFASVADAFIERYVKGASYVALEKLAKQKCAAEPDLKEADAFKAVCADSKNARLVARLGLGPKEREGISKRDEAVSVITKEFIKRWGMRPIADIEPEEVAAAIRAIVARGASYQAHNSLGYLRRLFDWAINTGEFGLKSSPVERLKPKDLIGERALRSRTLDDDELVAVWRSAEALGYPYGPLVRLLILSGQRLREVADMRWSEVNLAEKLWTIPAGRMKGGITHEVPLTPQMLAIFEKLPVFNVGDYVFSTTSGKTSVNGFGKTKVRLDKLCRVDSFVFHDLRRTMRTRLSALPVEDLVREAVIAHARPGLHKVYDQHSYRDEKRRCLELWNDRFESIERAKPKKAARVESSLAASRNSRAQPSPVAD